MLGVRLDPELERRLSALATKKDRSKSYIAKEALKAYIEQEEQLAQIKQATLERWQAFELHQHSIAHDEVSDWLDTWGTDDEQPWPSSK